MLENFDPIRGTAGDFTNKLMLAKIVSYDYQRDQNDQIVTDVNGRFVPTGLLNIQFLERDGTRQAPFCLMMGNTMMVGGLPEIGSYCIVGFRQQNQPVIVGFIPPGIANVTQGRRTLPNLLPGEVMVQASISDTDVDGNDQFFKGATVFCDRYGRYKVDCQDYELVVGYLMSDEYTSDVSWVNDPITGNPVYLRERCPAGVERRVDNQGNAIWTTGKNKVERIGGNIDAIIEGAVNQIAKSGTKFSDNKGNYIQIQETGAINLVSATGDVYHFANGKWDVEVVGNAHHKVMLSYSQTVGENLNVMVGGDRTIGIAGKDATTVTKGDSTEKITAGGKTITTLNDIVLNALGLVRANGSTYSMWNSEPFQDALSAFLTALGADLASAAAAPATILPVPYPTCIAPLATLIAAGTFLSQRAKHG